MQDNEASQGQFWERQQQIYKSAYISTAILVLDVILFVMSSSAFGWMYERGALITGAVLENGEYYRLLTAVFLHVDTGHLLNNMMMLFLVGAVVENYTGHVFYIIMYLLAGIIGNIVSMIYEVRRNLSWISVGASGALMGLVGFVVVWIIFNRKAFVRNKNVKMRLILLAVFIIYASFFQAGANTAAHFGGFVTGVIFGVINIIVFRNNKPMEGLA